MNNSQKRIIAIVIAVIAIINLILPYAKFEYYGPTVSYRSYKSSILIITMISIAYSALSYGGIIRIDRSKTKKSKLAVSLCILVLSIYKFATYSSSISIKNQESIYSMSKLLRQNVGFQRGIAIYIMVFLASTVTILNLLDLNKKEN